MDMESTGPVSSPVGGRQTAKEALVFALGALREPANVGAVAPASRWLARAVADTLMREVARGGCRSVVEIGAGTGALTRAILAQGLPIERFVAIESDPRFARWLRRRFARVEVIRGCASQVVQVLEPGAPTAIVSSLPFRSIPASESRRLVRAIGEALALAAGSVLIQYSYGFGNSPPFPAPASGLRWTVAKRVLMNLLPATVWTLRHDDPPDSHPPPP
jgi:phosphatidylethanolamine/phosphatidyl-N-methylethanolamine N-methyltransferase